MIALAVLLSLLIGLLAGFYCRDIYDKVKDIYDNYKKERFLQDAGVVRPAVSKVTKNQPINLESETGGVLRASPDQAKLNALKEREKRASRL